MMVSFLHADDSKKEINPIASISEAELRDHIFYLADDALEGRLIGSRGYAAAAVYGASQFRGAGLVPIYRDGSDQTTYFQSVKMIFGSLGARTVLHVNRGGKKQTYHLGKDLWIQKRDFIGFAAEGQPVFVGYGIDEPDHGWNDYENLDVAGKIVIAYTGAPQKGGEPILPGELNRIYTNTFQSINQRLLAALKRGVSTLLLVPDEKTAKSWQGKVGFKQRGFASSGDEAEPLSLQYYLIHPDAAAFLLQGTGPDPKKGRGGFRPAVLGDLRIKLEVDRQISEELASDNVVGMIRGSDPVLRDEYIVVSAHLDHLGQREGEVFNGADDNASGCAAIIDAAEALGMAPPRRSVIFALFTGEEGGAFGSRQFVARPPVPLEKIVLNINADMVGRNSQPFPEALLAISSAESRDRLSDMIVNANDTIAGAPVDIARSNSAPWTDFLYGSDQFCFIMRGIPAILVTRGFMQPDYHRASDDAGTVNYKKVWHAARLIYALTVVAANSDSISR